MELLDVLDENGEVTGRVETRDTVHNQGLWHTHVSVWIMNENGELLLQKRSAEKKRNPNKWSRTGGHVDAGETPLQGIQRETFEEVGVKIPLENFELILKEKIDKVSKKDSRVNRVFTYNYFTRVNYKLSEYTMQKEEVSDLKYITIEELTKIIDMNDKNYTFSKWDRSEFDAAMELLKEKRLLC